MTSIEFEEIGMPRIELDQLTARPTKAYTNR